MGFGLQQNINTTIANPAPGLADAVAQASDALEAVRAADISINATEERFLADIPGPVWEGMKPTLVGALRGELGNVTVSLGAGFLHTLSIAQQGSDVAIVLTAPLPEPPATSD